MSLDPGALARHVSEETGLAFEGRAVHNPGKPDVLELVPAGHRPTETFTLRITPGWRRLDIAFNPGVFSAAFIEAMSQVDETGRRIFGAVLAEAVNDGASVRLRLNDTEKPFEADADWPAEWAKIELSIGRGMLPLNTGDDGLDERLVRLWTGRAAAAVLALLPLEDAEDVTIEEDVAGLPEGAVTRVVVNRYERDRRNRAAALAIHGYRCKACAENMEEMYGEDAVGLVEVHHVTPVSMLGAGYIINPAADLVPLCPNCHAVIHRRTPPFSVEEVAEMRRRQMTAEGTVT